MESIIIQILGALSGAVAAGVSASFFSSHWRRFRRPRRRHPHRETSRVSQGRDEVTHLAEMSRRFLTVIATALALAFSWTQLREISFVSIINLAELDVLRRFIVLAFYFSWVLGSTFDITILEEMFPVTPTRRPWFTFIFSIFCLAIITGALLFAANNDQVFSLTLTAFFVVQLLSWAYTRLLAAPVFAKVRLTAMERHDYYAVERANILLNYLYGPSSLQRFVILGIIITMTDLICFVPNFRDAIGGLLSELIPGSSSAALANLLPSAFFLVFVMCSEVWLWMVRATIRISLTVIAAHEQRYRLLPHDRKS